MSVHQGHRARVKEKFLDNGFHGMHPHEILEFLLFFSIPRGDTNPIAHELIATFGSITEVFDAPIEELIKIKGIGESSAILIKSVPQFAREYAQGQNLNNRITTTYEAGNHLVPKFIGRTKETFFVTMLDNKSHIIKDVLVSEGTVNQVSVNVRKVVELSIKYQAVKVVMAHNHPKGFAFPSTSDEYTTYKIRDALNLIGIELFDHLIVVEDDYVSMRDSGCMNKYLPE